MVTRLSCDVGAMFGAMFVRSRVQPLERHQFGDHMEQRGA
jgi:hypothetical protein